MTRYRSHVRLICSFLLTGDAVYMRSEMKRQEYVLTQHGQIYRGTYKQIKGTPWNYGQVPNTMGPCSPQVL